MSEDFEPTPGNNYSSFWPLVILVSGLLIWFVLQDLALNSQRAAYNAQFQDQQLQATFNESRNITTRYVSLMKDLLQTAQKDPAAAQIVKDAVAAGLIHVQPNGTNTTANPAAPAAPAK
jgi:hypothetical protein